jgi:hypothetical protein
MKKILFVLTLVVSANLLFAQGKFSASISNTNNVITFKVRPDQNVNTGFSGIEFFLMVL